MRKRTFALATAALAAILVLAGCTNSMGGTTGEMSSPSEASTEPFNDADVDFAMNMVAHHTQAIEMADVLLSKDGVDTQVVELAQNIKAAQGPEIATMNEWLDAWGASGMSGMDHGMGQTMSDEDMAALEAASGPDAGRLFLEQMTVHHQGAIDMAQVEIEEGENPDAIALAEKIVADQTAEIALMADILATL